LPVKTGLERGVTVQGRVERVQEMEEMVETVLGMWDGIQVHCFFHTVENDLEYKDLLTSVFTQADHERG
jgi:hypothetical protein